MNAIDATAEQPRSAAISSSTRRIGPPSLRAGSDDSRDHEQRGDRERPRDEPLGHRPDVPDTPAAAVVGVLNALLDIAGERVEVGLGYLALAELRHQVRADPDRLGDLCRGRVVKLGRETADHDTALAGDRMTGGAVLGEELGS